MFHYLQVWFLRLLKIAFLLRLLFLLVSMFQRTRWIIDDAVVLFNHFWLVVLNLYTLLNVFVNGWKVPNLGEFLRDVGTLDKLTCWGGKRFSIWIQERLLSMVIDHDVMAVNDVWVNLMLSGYLLNVHQSISGRLKEDLYYEKLSQIRYETNDRNSNRYYPKL